MNICASLPLSVIKLIKKNQDVHRLKRLKRCVMSICVSLPLIQMKRNRGPPLQTFGLKKTSRGQIHFRSKPLYLYEVPPSSGMFPPSSGEVTVQDYNIFKHMDQFRDSLGLCPQHNLLFPYLSVIQHLIFFGMVSYRN